MTKGSRFFCSLLFLLSVFPKISLDVADQPFRPDRNAAVVQMIVRIVKIFARKEIILRAGNHRYIGTNPRTDF